MQSTRVSSTRPLRPESALHLADAARHKFVLDFSACCRYLRTNRHRAVCGETVSFDSGPQGCACLESLHHQVSLRRAWITYELRRKRNKGQVTAYVASNH